MNPSDITFVVLTKDEAPRITGCLASLPSGSNALVCDSQSADGTADLARDAGARVVDAPWRGFAQSRLDAAALVTTPWTFMLDADELITPELSLELTSLDVTSQTAAYSVPRRNYFCGNWIRGAGWWPDRLVRLFRTGHATLAARHGGDAAVHETWVPDGACGELASPLEHHSYESLAEYRDEVRALHGSRSLCFARRPVAADLDIDHLSAAVRLAAARTRRDPRRVARRLHRMVQLVVSCRGGGESDAARDAGGGA